ncbi:MAG TPA: tetratricopeptide repeat protein, partial [Phycisphaerae bacterium]|nr:tetratricopeptide repeat protein [Phycisphaerae bacterium]
LLHKIAQRYIALLKGPEKGSGRVWEPLSYAANDKKDTQSVFGGVYDRMGWENAVRYLFNQANSYGTDHREQWVAEMAKLAAVRGFGFSSWAQVRDLTANLYQWSGSYKTKVPASLIDAMWKHYLAGADRAKSYDAWFEGKVYGLYRYCGHEPEAAKFLSEYYKLIAKRDPAGQIDSCGALYSQVAPPVEAPGTLEPGKYYHTMLKVIGPLYEKVSADGAEGVYVYQKIADSARWLATVTQEEWKPLKEQGAALARVLVEALMAGSGFSGDSRYRLFLTDVVVPDALARDDWQALSRLLPFYAETMRYEANWDENYRLRIGPIARGLEDKKADELVYGFITSVARQHALPDRVLKQAMVIKSRASRGIPGLIPVKKTDPTYDLHVAGQMLALGDESRAWELTTPRLGLLPKVWESLDGEYVAWCVDQLRVQKKLKESLELAFTVLLREKDLSPALAARFLLIKGDIYRDMENFQAAKIEYQSLRANNRYHKTAAGSRALYRLIDLFITMGDTPSAEAILERLVDSEDVRVQAEAYFLYAKMAFGQEEYEEAADYLKKVRERVLDHVEAAFLEGELKLHITRGLVDPEVPVGPPELRTVAIPKRVLTMKLRDTNLAIARGSAAVPVVIRTSKGGDEEHVKLLPSSADRYLFIGQIPTSLGPVRKGNMNLELLGQDIVSYLIEPAYQKANDLHYPPKNLTVKANGLLAASSGEILSDKERERRALEQKIRAVTGDRSRRFDVLRSGTTIRPGSPIYVQVTDLDRDLSIARDKVAVQLATSSGDVIEAFEIEETGPHTGVFGGKVPTGIPLPKAAASDTAEGKHPSCLINSTRNETWSSLADARKPKFVEVDTMSSHEMKTVSIDVAEPERIQQVSLQGMLADEYEELAAYPARTEEQKGGLLLEHVFTSSGTSPDQMRKALKTQVATRKWQESPAFRRDQTEYKGRYGWMVARVRGTFWLPTDRSLELKFIQPLSPNNWQTACVLIDGRLALGGNITKNTLEWTKRVDLFKGAHRLEVLVHDHHRESQAVVAYRKDDGTFAPLPAKWFSKTDNPELAEHLKPKGSIARKEGKLVATLDAPKRLRKVKWVFEEFTGNDVAA